MITGPFAEFSHCVRDRSRCIDPYCSGRRYRYLLGVPTGCHDPLDRVCLFVLANPSTATPEVLDPTVRRCRTFAKRWGYGRLWVANVRAWRETNPKLLPPDPDAIGILNDERIEYAAQQASVVICGWGKLGGERGEHVAGLIRKQGRPTMCLGRNKDGSPKHPLYLRGNAMPMEMKDGGDR